MSQSPATRRLRTGSHGRHRVAILMAAAIFLVGILHLLAAAVKAIFATSIFLNAFLSGLVPLTSQPGILIGLSAAAVVFGLFRMHPGLQPNYRSWLCTTPWSPGAPMPLGSFRLTDSGLFLPLAAVALLYAIRAQTADFVAIGVVLGNAMIAAIGALIAERPKLALTLLMIALPILPAMTNDSQLTFWLSLVMLLIVSDLAHGFAIQAAFEQAKQFDFKRLNNQSRSKLGYLHHMKLTPDPSDRWLLVVVALAGGVGSTCFMLTFRANNGAEVVNVVSFVLIILQIATTLSHFAHAPWSYGPIARILTGTWFAPRMDRILVGPIAMLIYIAIVNSLPWRRSEATPFMAGAYVGVGIGLALFMAMPRLQWQILGATRIQLTPTASQKQVETVLKRR